MASSPAAGAGLAALLALPRPGGRPGQSPATPAPQAAQPDPAAPATRAALAAIASAGVMRTPGQVLPARRGTPLRTPLRELAILRDRRLRQEHNELLAVRAARAAGHSWQEVADALGVPLTTAHRRFR